MASPGEPDQDLSIEDIVRAKELTIDAARDLTVIGADDPHFEALMQRAGDTPVCVVSLDPPHPNAIRHREGGGITMLLDTQKGKPLVTHWQAGSLAGTYASETITGLQSADNAEALTSACFACGLAVGLGVTLGEPS
jgi:hypothetical protein